MRNTLHIVALILLVLLGGCAVSYKGDCNVSVNADPEATSQPE
jgi:hypothetical protein